MLGQGWTNFLGWRAKIGLVNEKILPRANQNL